MGGSESTPFATIPMKTKLTKFCFLGVGQDTFEDIGLLLLYNAPDTRAMNEIGGTRRKVWSCHRWYEK